MTDATPEQIVAFLTGRPMTDLGPHSTLADLWLALTDARAEVERLTAERANRYWEGRWRDEVKEVERLTAYVEEWKRRYETARLAHEEARAEVAEWQDRYEAEHRDHLATIKHADALEDECHKLERE